MTYTVVDILMVVHTIIGPGFAVCLIVEYGFHVGRCCTSNVRCYNLICFVDYYSF